jgi:N-methylhydantoinase B
LPNERVLKPLSDGNPLVKADILRIETGGGGGQGHPHDRPSDKVLADVLGGYVSVEAAARLYGVAIEGREIDATETARLRATRPEVKAFHRKEYVDVLD